MKSRATAAALLAGSLLAAAAPAAGAAAPHTGHLYGKAPRGSIRAVLVKALYAPRYADVYADASPIRTVKAAKADRRRGCAEPTLAHREAVQTASAQTQDEETLSLAAAQEAEYATPRLAAKAYGYAIDQFRCGRSGSDRIVKHVYRGRNRRAVTVTETVVTSTLGSGADSLRALVVVDLAGKVVVQTIRFAANQIEVDPKPERDLALSLARLGAARGLKAIVRAA